MDTTELLARMWIECDPNRGGPGCEPDAPHTFADGREGKRWEWFVPRAEATQEFLAKHGLKLVQA